MRTVIGRAILSASSTAYSLSQVISGLLECDQKWHMVYGRLVDMPTHACYRCNCVIMHVNQHASSLTVQLSSPHRIEHIIRLLHSLFNKWQQNVVLIQILSNYVVVNVLHCASLCPFVIWFSFEFAHVFFRVNLLTKKCRSR